MSRFLKSISLIFLFLFFYATFVFAEDITITTYYPSPYGSYSSLFADKLGVGDNNGDGVFTSADVPATTGNAWIKGNVGIGTMDLSQGMLVVKAAAPMTLPIATRANIVLDSATAGATDASSLWFAKGGDVGASICYGWENEIGFWTKPGGVWQENIRFSEDGEIGIGVPVPTYQLQLSTDSAGKPNGGSWANSSDRRLKKDVKDIDSPLELMLKLRGRQFSWINAHEHGNLKQPRFGFIAQETEEIFPDWVSEIQPQGKDKELVKEGKVKSMGIFGFEALAVEAIRQLKEENDSLKERIKALEEKIK